MPKSISDQIKDLENTRAAKVARNEKITQKASDEGRTLDEAEQEELDTNADEIDALDADLLRLRRLEKQLAAAKPIRKEAAERPERAAESRSPVIETTARKSEPGLGLARVAKCLGRARGNWMQAELIARKLYGDNDPCVGFLKAAVEAGTTVSGNWAANLVGEETSVFADFVEWLRPQTILGKFGMDGVPSLRRVPFRSPLVSQTAGGRGWWVGEGKPKPLTKLDFGRDTLAPNKAATIAVLSQELIRDSSPSADPIIRNELRDALRELLDQSFIDPANTGSVGIAPASITESVTPITSSGSDADAVRADVKALVSSFVNANNQPTEGVWIMPATLALSLSLMVNALGNAEFPGITMNGGTFFGLPVISSQYVPTVTAGGYVVLVNASDIYFADDGDVTIDVSNEASLEMQDDESLAQDQPTGASLVSLWQNNLVGFLAERTVNWRARRENASVALLEAVNWGDLTS